MRLIVNIEAGNLVDVEETTPGHFRARMKPEANSVYPYPSHQLCWFICRFEGVAAAGETCQLTLVNCEWNPDAFRTQRPFLCYETDWSRSTAWTHEGLTGMQLDWTRSESSRGTPGPRAPRDGREGVAAGNLPRLPQAATAAPTAVALAPATPSPTPTTARSRSAQAPFNKRETATLSLFPPPEESLAPPPGPAPSAAQAAATKPVGPAMATAVATPPPPASASDGGKSAPETLTSSFSGLTRDFTGGSMTYTFHLKSDCTVALHPPYTLERLKADLERWGTSPHLHYQRLGASHGGKSFFVVEAARHRNKGINPALPFVVLLAREHGAEPAVNWVVRGLMDRLLKGDGHRTLDRLRLVLFPFVNQDGAYQGMTVDPYTGLDVGNDFGRASVRPAGSSGTGTSGTGANGEVAAGHGGLTGASGPVGSGGGGGGSGEGSLEFKLPETRLMYRFVADQIRSGRHCLGAISLHQPHGAQENIWPVYYLGPGRNCLDRSLTSFQTALHRHTREFTHTVPDFWPIRVSVGRFDHDFGIPGVTLEINPHCARHPLSVPDLEKLGAGLADTLGDWAGPV